MQKTATILILDSVAGRAAQTADALAASSPDSVEVRGQPLESADALAQALGSGPADAVIVRLGGGGEAGLEADVLDRFARQGGGPATVVLAQDVPLDRQLEWVHRGIQDVLPVSTPPEELLRTVLVSMERRHLLSDVQEALRLEQDNVVKMQAFIDELVGFATRSATHSG